LILLLALGQLGMGQTMVSAMPEAPYLSPALKEEFTRGDRIVKKILPGGIGYLRVPSMVVEPSEYNQVAQQLMDSLCALQREGARKWVIDLRLNAAGTIFPMIAGLSPLLGNGAFLGYAQGGVVSMTRLKDGKFSSPDGGVAEVKGGGSLGTGATGRENRASGPNGGKNRGAGTSYPEERASVVILTGHGTGSAGECVAIAFKGRPRTWFIGEPTAGFVAGNKGAVLAGDRVDTMTMRSVRVDRRHRGYPRNLIPDEWVPGGEDFSDYGQDRKIQAAIRQLEKN
jgi:hypothetical protein